MTYRDIIAEYYPRIDAHDIDWVVGLFHADAVYQRAEARYSGISEIDDFFRNRRKISGEHRIERIWHEGNDVIAVGEFNGQGEAGDARSVGFVDIWTFNDDGKVALRRSYLLLGQAYVLA